jgi:hypothetical protein
MNDIPINIQLRALIEAGLSMEEAAQCLELDIEAVKLTMLTGVAKRTIDADKLIEESRADCIQALIDIGLNKTGQYNPNTRIQAIRVLMEGKSSVAEIPVNKLSETYKKMKDVCMKYNQTEIKVGENLKDSANVTLTLPQVANDDKPKVVLLETKELV